ncbi:MAG: site-specific DNA-methyltransferase [Chloroflexota bacterium]
MPRNKTTEQDQPVTDYRYAEKRKNIPPAGLAGKGKVKEVPKTRYAYDPHLPPVLRFDSSGNADQLPELLQTARQRPLTQEETQILVEALRNRQPWLEWAGKREKDWFEVDPVALHIHERISAQAILKLAQREPLQRSLFADPELEYHQAIQFYQHDVDWSNRLILGDSLTVMHSLAKREDLAGKVQMIYIDPPYGIKFASNFQSQIGKREVKDKNDDLTREPEQIKAYRDTWTLGIHSYLEYLRDRLILAKELLKDNGSIFVQISDENLHRIRIIMDEVFGSDNFCGIISFSKTVGQSTILMPSVMDFILWYSKNKDITKYHKLFMEKESGGEGATGYILLELHDGRDCRSMTKEEINNPLNIPTASKIFDATPIVSQGFVEKLSTEITFQGQSYFPPSNRHWTTTPEGIERLKKTNRLILYGRTLQYRRYIKDYPVTELGNIWLGLGERGFVGEKLYVVQTASKVIERCLLMTTDPGDLVLDPTCGSGTTAYVAEQWGRRWISIDTSRVALSLARQRLLTSKFDYYELAEPGKGPTSGFKYKTVPHITLKSIAQNQALDPIFARWETRLKEKLAFLNTALAQVSPPVRTRLAAKLAEKERRGGKSAVNDGDRRRWLLPREQWQEWEVPFDSDPDYPQELKSALEAYRQDWRSKMDEVNAAITASAPQETLVDQPKVLNNIVRVSGPFTVEGIQPLEETLDLDSPIGGEPQELETFSEEESTNAEAYLEKMTRLLKQDGVRFPDNKVVKFARLEPLTNSLLHAGGEWGEPSRRVAVSFGPQYGPITAKQVEECLHIAARRGYDDLVFAGFTIDGAAQAIVQDDANPMVQCHLAHIRPDVNMGDLLKDTPGSQLFTVFGLPRVHLEAADNGEWVAVMEGVDIYDPVNNTIQATHADKVAAWFLDSDYDGRTFCITQAFFPDSSAWEKIARVLKSTVDPERFAAFSGTRSLPFPVGENRRVAVKVIDPRGNEAIKIVGFPQN